MFDNSLPSNLETVHELPELEVMLAPEIETDRLILRPFREDDFSDFLRMERNPAMQLWELDEFTEQESYYQRRFAGLVQRGIIEIEGVVEVSYLVMTKTEKLPVGYVTCVQMKLNWWGLHFGFHIAEPHWGKGYATEAGRALIDFAFSRGLTQLYAGCYEGNVACARALTKIGFHQKRLTFTEKYIERRFCRKGYYMLHFSLTAEQWRAKQ